MPAVLVLLLIAAGCDEEPVRTYRVPKPRIIDPATGQPHQHQQQQPATAAAPITAAQIQFDTPADWQPTPPGRMVDFAFTVGEGDDAPLVTVSFFQMAMNAQANVNRWLNQVGQPPVDATTAEGMLERMADRVDESYYAFFTGPKKAIAVVMIRQGGGWWFVKLDGDPAAVEQNLAPFKAFVRSIHFEQEGPDE